MTNIDHGDDVVHSMEELFESETFSDLTLSINIDSQFVFNVHKLVLASRCQYFR